MLTTSLKLADKYDYLEERFQKAFRFLKNTDLLALPVGNVPIDGENIYANVQSYRTMEPSDCPFEGHKKYFDIQYVAEGEELFGYEPAANLEAASDYDEEKDLLFFKEPPESGAILMKKGRFRHRSPGRRPRAPQDERQGLLPGEKDCGKSEDLK